MGDELSSPRQRQYAAFEFSGLTRELENIQEPHSPAHIQHHQHHPAAIAGPAAPDWAADFMGQKAAHMSPQQQPDFEEFENIYRQQHHIPGPSAPHHMQPGQLGVGYRQFNNYHRPLQMNQTGPQAFEQAFDHAKDGAYCDYGLDANAVG